VLLNPKSNPLTKEGAGFVGGCGILALAIWGLLRGYQLGFSATLSQNSARPVPRRAPDPFGDLLHVHHGCNATRRGSSIDPRLEIHPRQPRMEARP
jgi:hypothetical protein